MQASRLRRNRKQHTVNVITKTMSGGYSESNAYTGLTATHEQRDAFELMTDTGAVIMVTDVFWFAKTSGTLPTITEEHAIEVGTVRYEIFQVADQGGQGNRLRVMTRRAR